MRPYPDTAEAIAATSMLGGPAAKPVPEHISNQFAAVHAMYGSGDLDRVAKNPGAASTNPWPSGGKTKKGPAYSKEHVAQALSQPPNPQPIDPRNLHSSQPGITRQGVDYYLNSHQYHDTGETYADRGQQGNRHPVVYRSQGTGRNLILSGHHRAAAALLAGKPLRAIQVEGP